MAIPNQALLREFVRAFDVGQPQSDKAVSAAVELVRAHLHGKRKKGRPLKSIGGKENRRVLAAILDIAGKVAKGETRESAFFAVANKYSISKSTLRRYWKKGESLKAMGEPDVFMETWPTLSHVLAGRTNPFARQQ
jgi:hypothetical protein